MHTPVSVGDEPPPADYVEFERLIATRVETAGSPLFVAAVDRDGLVTCGGDGLVVRAGTRGVD